MSDKCEIISILDLNITNINHFQPLVVVVRSSDTHLQVDGNLKYIIYSLSISSIFHNFSFNNFLRQFSIYFQG